MRLMLITGILTFPIVATAQVISQHASVSANSERTVVRHVMLKDEHGVDVLVEQKLIELQNGDYVYLHDSQPQATKDLDERICASMGSSASHSAVSRWSPETLGGGVCRDEHPVEPAVRAKRNAEAIFIQAIAPGSYVVPAGQNSAHRGSANYSLDSAGTITGELVVDSRCRSSLSDYVPGPGQGSTWAYVNCFMPAAGNFPTQMNACAGARCSSDRNSITAF